MNDPLLVFIIFCHNTGSSVISTSNELIVWLREIEELEQKKIGFVFVDDYSQSFDSTNEIIYAANLLRNQSNALFVDLLRNEKILGLSGSIQRVLNHLKQFEFKNDFLITQLPGNDQVPSSSLRFFYESRLCEGLVILFRNNLEMRPFFKRKASLVLQKIARFVVKTSFIEATANFMAPASFYERWAKPTSGHAYGIWLIAGARYENMMICNRGFDIKSRLERNRFQRNFPKLNNVVKVTWQLIKITFTLRKSL
jgi:hypothetical protein